MHAVNAQIFSNSGQNVQQAQDERWITRILAIIVFGG
jgi:hypothetical protein